MSNKKESVKFSNIYRMNIMKLEKGCGMIFNAMRNIHGNFK